MPDSSTITANCRVAQQLLSQIEKADAVSRINRGRTYNSTLDLLFAMNARLSSNRIAAPHLTELTSDFQNQLTTWRNNYDHYDDALAAAVDINCTAKPADFYNQLVNARDQRQTLNENVKNLNQTINDYKTELAKVTRELP